MKHIAKYFKRFLPLLILTSSPLLSFSQCENQSKGGQLKIITWNIYMLPHLFVHTGQAERAKEIADTLKNVDADVIVFEEAFDNKARNIIRNNLKAYFPYESGDPGKKSMWKTSCGVWIISKVPIDVVKQIYYKEANGSDRLATKGAILVEGQKDGFCFQLVGTHLQSDLNSGKNVQPIRDKQYAELKKQLLEPYSLENIPQFVAGDFNTIHDDSCCYNHMVGTLKFTPCPLEGDKCYSYDYTKNDLVIGTNNKPQLIDYILYSAPPQQAISGSMQIVVFSKKWDIRHKDLSDHFAVSGIFSYGESNPTAFIGTK
ncbi:MAG TPA: sphingomyelin phosphodiesterase [Bacteroidia bacterium]|jgi:endonuclease/exonuclease/phosphatase family metal-dependent hydrolase|nr:sphingomyelin phosphodiesterase [Bacteroidia bacterium]